MEKLAIRLLPLYARVLKVDPDFFKDAFKSPMFRLGCFPL
jgi:isopenicillin N synthase-like dioxygenase